MLNLALTGLESAINTALRLDPETLTRLSALEEKIIGIDITDWNITFYIIPEPDGIRLTTQPERPADTTLSGTLVGLFNVGCAKGRSDALFKHKINFCGDIAVGESIRTIMTHIDIDWEEHLSRWVGDTAAHTLGQGIRKTLKAGKRFSATLQSNVTEFLQHEIALTPTSGEVEHFVKNVQTLQHDTDRAEARLNLLLAKRGIKP